MASYTSYNEAFNNNDNLDKLARRMNNDKKKIHKKIEKNMSETDNNTYYALDCLNNPNNAKYSPNLKNAGFFSTQGDFSSQLPTPMEISQNKSLYSDSDSSFTKNTNGTNSTTYSNNSYGNSKSFWPNTEMDMTSNYSSLTPKMKKKFRQTVKHLKKYSDTEEKNILSHIKQCTQCQNELINIVNNGHIVTNNNNKNDTNNNINNANKNILNISHPELILILIGIFIIIVIDVFFRR